jgi:hypothetical protein
MSCSVPATNFLSNASAITGPAPPRVDDFSAVWTAIVNHPIVKNPENPRLWSLHGGIKWIGGIQELYNRPCYDEVTKNISALTHALVIGTPGIGKTLYLQVLLVHLFTRAKARGRATPTIHYTYAMQKKIVTLSFLSDGSVIDITDAGRVPAPEYLLSDSVDLSTPYGTVLNIEVASDKARNYNDFEKRIGEPGALRGKTIIMPLWSFDELTCIRPDTMDLELAQFRYHIYGGSARNFMFLKHVTCRVLPVVEDTMNLVFRYAKIDELYPDEWSNIARHISARLRSEDDANSANPSTLNSMLQHLFQDRTKIWASKFMELLAGAIFEDRSNDIGVELSRLIRSSGKGYLFESLGHRKLLKSQIPFTLKPLLNPLPDDKPVFPSAQFNLSVILFNTIAEISCLPDGTYGLPMTDNFPLLDAIVQPNMLIQFTISPTWHDGSVKNLPDICAGLHEKDLTKVKMVFVIPKNSVATFRGQQNLVVDGIPLPQYICLDDPSVINETTFMTVKEKQIWTQKTNG